MPRPPKGEACHGWATFRIPQELSLSLEPSFCPLLRLPDELLLKIYRGVLRQDRVYLALTCKRFLNVSASATTLVPYFMGGASVPFCNTVQRFLRLIKPLNSKGEANRSWLVCCDCKQYRPTNSAYWKRKRKQSWAYIGADRWSERYTSWSRGISFQCPECWCKEYWKKPN